MKFVVIYGPPGVGKLTVATELGRLTGFKLFDNHMTIDWALNFFDFGHGGFWDLVHSFRRSVLQECTKANIDLIFTCVYQIEDLRLFEERCQIVEENGGAVYLVQLTCNQDELERRIGSPDRIARPNPKLSSVVELQDLMERRDLLSPIPGRESLRIDNSDASPKEVARLIAEHYGLPMRNYE